MTQPTLSRTVDVETPELVVLSYTVAGVGSRVAAALIDYLICVGGFLLFFVSMAIFGGRGGGPRNVASAAWAAAVLGIAQFVIMWLYYVLFEAYMDGQTPGKRIMRLRVVRDGGLSVNFAASAVRNLVRVVDMQPGFFYLAGITSIVFSRSGKRLGDFAAGTLVVREEIVHQPDELPSARPGDVSSPENASRAAYVPTLTDREYELLGQFLNRRSAFATAHREQLARQLTERFAAALPSDTVAGDERRLQELHDAERDGRARGIASRRETGAARERHAIVAASSSRWARFADRIRRAQSRGFSTLGEDELREFVQEYRESTADLARLRTATRGRDAREVFYLNRLVSSAHNLLYRRTSLTPRQVTTFLFLDVPREIRRSWRPVALAASLLFLPMLISATAVVQNPNVAEMMVPPQMFSRADEGVEAARSGKGGYIEVPELYRPVFASSIITNNVQVAFFAFAAGITAGLLTIYMLLMNGVSIGAVFGLYISRDIGSVILAFVAPHGVLELSAIAIAGGAGLLLGASFWLPGNRTRRDALVTNARRSITLVAGAATFLVVAGMLEGFVSPNNNLPLPTKLLISSATAVVMAAYLCLGLRRPQSANAEGHEPEPATVLRAP